MAPKKDTAKKAPAKKKIKETPAKPPEPKKAEQKKEIHKEIPQQHYFLLIDGSAIKGLEEFADTLERMSEDVFYYHVNEFRNDFASWVKDVFNEKELAEHLQLAKTIEQTHIQVLKHIIKQLKKL